MNNSNSVTNTQTQSTQKTTAKTLQPSDSHQIQTNNVVGGLGLAFGLLSGLVLLLFGGYKLYSNKKGKTFIKNLIDEVEHDIIKVKEDFMNKKQDVLLNPTINQDDKLKQVKELNKDYQNKIDVLEAKRRDLKRKIK